MEPQVRIARLAFKGSNVWPVYDGTLFCVVEVDRAVMNEVVQQYVQNSLLSGHPNLWYSKVLFEAMGRRIRAQNDELVKIISSCFIYCNRLIVRS
jgi:hypothetical protein